MNYRQKMGRVALILTIGLILGYCVACGREERDKAPIVIPPLIVTPFIFQDGDLICTAPLLLDLERGEFSPQDPSIEKGTIVDCEDSAGYLMDREMMATIVGTTQLLIASQRDL